MNDFEVSIRHKIEILSRSITYLTAGNTTMEEQELLLLTDALDKLVENDSKVTLLTERLSNIDKDLIESFNRVDKRLLKVEAIPTWVAKIVTTIIIGALLSLIIVKA